MNGKSKISFGNSTTIMDKAMQLKDLECKCLLLHIGIVAMGLHLCLDVIFG